VNLELLSTAELEADFTPLLAVPDHEAYIERGARLSAAVRGRLRSSLDLAYGDTALQKLDVFTAENPHVPVVVFIHGGYWYSLDKSDYSYVAAPLVAAGATTVLINYDLCPVVTLDEIVRQCIRAVAWVYRHIASATGRPPRLYVSGNSAGAHLAAMALAHDWTAEALPADLISGVFCITGIYDVTPLPRISTNDLIGLTSEIARRNSPMFLRPATKAAALVVVGGDETPGWIRQSTDYASMLRRHGVPVELMVVEGHNHFSIAESLGDPESQAARAIVRSLQP
jgi:arylformamidase